MKLIFMGTPAFAVPGLAALLQAGHEILAVVTAPDKPSGRGLEVNKTAVKVFAEEKGLPVLQPIKLKDPGFLQQLSELKPQLQVVVAFRMLPRQVWEMPAKGTINLHASLLPQYRGAAPINWAIINGETETGLSTFFLNDQIDTGNILFQSRLAIGDKETAGELHDRMMHEGASLLLKTVQAIEQGDYSEQKQELADTTLKLAPKLFREDGEISWTASAVEIYNRIRGLSPYPAAYTSIQGKQIKIFKAGIVDDLQSELPAGTFLSDGKSYLHVQTGRGKLALLELQIESKKRMEVSNFLKGFRFQP